MNLGKILNFFFFTHKFKVFVKSILFKKERFKYYSYWKYGQKIRQDTFYACARFLNINRPIEGYYFEFGCNEANTFRMAYDTFHHLFDFKYYAFDSFEGLPEISEIDRCKIFYKGKLKQHIDLFKKILINHGIPSQKFEVVKGFYKDSLNERLVKSLSEKKVAVAYIDCDLYESTVNVLNLIKNFLQPGSLIVFDDWNCFLGSEEKGQRKAFGEFCA